MGRDLFAQFPDLVATANAICGYDLPALCQEDPQHALRHTRYAQPAVYTVNALAYRRWLREHGSPPDIALGHSLGEYNALEAAGVFDFDEGLRLVLQRAQLTASISGAMTAVLGLPVSAIHHALTDANLTAVELVNLNTPTQTVLAGSTANIVAAEQVLLAAGAFDVRRLDVSGPFHSSLMHPAAVAYTQALAAVKMRQPRLPVVANRTARPHLQATIATALAEHIDHPVRWQDSIKWTLENYLDVRFNEIGDQPGVLLRMLRQLLPPPNASTSSYSTTIATATDGRGGVLAVNIDSGAAAKRSHK
ncbi:hypothetical protein A6A27_36150 [Micromonospora sp. CB01531]|nr:hypothetical protein A6A27_36150 [Micromonospora sp. CB01531]